MVWCIGVMCAGCNSQGPDASPYSLKEQAARERQALYDKVELIAGSGAEEDEPAEEETSDAAEPAEPDASIADRIAEEQSWADDSPACGNGELDEGELCDYGILEGEGACPERCDPLPGCPDETLVVHGCRTHCLQHEEPSEACLAAQQP